MSFSMLPLVVACQGHPLAGAGGRAAILHLDSWVTVPPEV